MSASLPLMALLNADARPSVRNDSAHAAPSAEGAEAFADLLAEHLPAELQAAIKQMSPEQLATLEQAALAADGKSLPSQVQNWLEQLPLDGDVAEQAGDDVLTVIGQWMQWLQETTRPGAGPVPAGSISSASGALTPSPGQPMGAQPAMLTDGDDAARLTTEGGQVDRELLSREGADKQLLNGELNRPSRQVAQAQNAQPDFPAVLQRAAATQNDSQPLSAAMLGKLAEQLERGSPGRSGGETDAIDGLARPGTYGTTAAALTARPVVATTQSMGVPFGQPSWGEAMVEKVMWMSSQNLRSVEIQLDPAELGPLEIHIQHRGQELQVQFVSQNPSVREALEAQMHRLRDMFGQQGLDQAEVTVADRSAGEQPGQRDGQPAERTGGRGSGDETLLAGNNNDTSEQPESRTQWTPTQRLVDYYA